MQTSRKLPSGWENYSPIGNRIENTPFVPFKVPLKPTTCKRLSKPENSFTVEDLLDREPRLGLIIDLTFTYYYDPDILRKRNVEYKKIFLRGGGELPPWKDVHLFFDTVKRFTEKSDKLIGVHCTHGVNRTGFMICKYMIEELSCEPKEAIEAFEKARGFKIVREAYTLCLLKGGNRGDKIKNKEPRVPKSFENRLQNNTRRNYDRRGHNTHTNVHDQTWSHQTNPSFMSFNERSHVPQGSRNDYQQFPMQNNTRRNDRRGRNTHTNVHDQTWSHQTNSANQQSAQFKDSGRQYRNFYNSAPQTNSVYRYRSNDRFPGREHLHGNQNYVYHQNFYSYQPNQRFY